jgi:hypothetical protein
VQPGEELVAALTRAPLPALRRLRMAWARLSPAGAESLANWPGAAPLRHLDLSWNVEMRAAGLRHLLDSPYLRDLQTFDVTPLTAEHDLVAAMLRERFGGAGPRPGDERHSLRATLTR